MQFPNQIVTEVTAPNNVAFQPGNVVTGFGSIIPPELAAAGFVNAIVFYDVDWNPTNTTPTIKFRFIASGMGNIKIGYGYCANPSVSQTATVVATANIGAQISGNSIFSLQEWRSLANATTFIMGHTFGTNDPLLQMFDQNAILRLIIQRIAANGVTTISAGNNWQLNIADGATVASVNGPINKDGAWQAFTLFNGWFGNANPDQPLYRMMNDGTVMFTGLVNKGSAPVNGEKWGSVAAGWLPLKQAGFHACSDLTGDGNQKIIIDSTGACFIFDPPAGNGSMFLSAVRYPTTLIP